MATVTGLTAAKMLEIANASVVAGSVNGAGGLILATRGGLNIDAGHVKGDIGDTGPKGSDGILGGTVTSRNTYFGIPTVMAAQVALANRGVVWYNVDNRWFEIYQATTGMAGLNVPGVQTSPGWYPVNIDRWDQMSKGLTYNKNIFTVVPNLSDAIVYNIPTYDFKKDRCYRIVWDASYYQSSTVDLFFWSINTAPVGDASALLTNLTLRGGRTRGIGPAGANNTQYTGPVTAYYEPTIDATYQIKFRVQRALGAGTVSVVGSMNDYATYHIYDDGASPLQAG